MDWWSIKIADISRLDWFFQGVEQHATNRSLTALDFAWPAPEDFSTPGEHSRLIRQVKED